MIMVSKVYGIPRHDNAPHIKCTEPLVGLKVTVLMHELITVTTMHSEDILSRCSLPSSE